MLFDLRGRGRRRSVQVIYVSLAILMGGGLVFFGIGGATSGGLFDALGLTGNGGGGSSSNNIFAKRGDRLQKQVRLRPRAAALWDQLAKTRFSQAAQEGYDSNTGGYTKDGRKILSQASVAWQRYLALNPPKPDVATAKLMLQAYGPSGLADYKHGVSAAEVITEAEPSSSAFRQLATYAYLAGQTRTGDLARQQAIDRAPKASRASLKQELAQLKQQATQTAAPPGGQSAQPSPGG